MVKRSTSQGILVRNGSIFLVRRSAKKERHAGEWNFPGGGIEEGETPEQALKREMFEELGIIPTSYKLLKKIVDEEGGLHCHYLFLVTGWTGKIKLDWEAEESAWLAVKEALKLELPKKEFYEKELQEKVLFYS